MSKPREIWWGYVKAIIRRYPELCAKEAELHRQSLSRGMAGMPLNDRTTVTVEDAAAARWLRMTRFTAPPGNLPRRSTTLPHCSTC